ncbi:CCA tRNA nucleotidyltransferase [Desulfosarcina ovata]|uniref:Polynucleotide adenylyltransferase n=1 Tax=Desulfosarcina ovata subsp. ovata TaxID=2752305 RepID=A0A5K8AL63_9BACT|nr:HD domain-containing protein [Desulfosarcina ovata]BBO93477.1 polynucleotide adenylyltransferase [Desulfosarcina ovata subsp. ovata]
MDQLTDIRFDFLPDPPDGIYLVGGALRDMLTGRTPLDIDLVVRGEITAMATQLAERTGGRLVDLGKKGFPLFRIVSPAATIDITPMTGQSIEADLQARDFTLNAMAYDLKAKRLIDCTGGLADIRRKVIRIVSPDAFVHDPARLVRAYRFAAELDFVLADATGEAIADHRHRIETVAGERIWAELIKILNTSRCAATFRLMAASGLLTAIFPELEPSIGCTQNRHHRFDVFEHSLRAVDCLETLLADFDRRFPDLATVARRAGLPGQAPLLKYSALLHDVGKPATRQIEADGRVRFPGHAAKSALIAQTINRRLRLSRQQDQITETVIRHHIRPLFLFIAWQNGTLGPNGKTRFFNRCGPLALPIVVHAMADIMAKGKTLENRDSDFIRFCHRLAVAHGIFQDRQATTKPLINGYDLINELGLAPSPRFKQLLSKVDEQRLCGTLSSREQALGWVRAYLKRSRPHADA